MSGDPFAALGLTARPDLTDDEVRAAWRRVAAATHPDRDDGGDPHAFTAAAAAYTDLRTETGRREARDSQPVPRRHPGPRLARIRRGRPVMLALRLALAAAISLGAVLAVGFQPASYAIITAALTWLIRTAGRELAPPGRGGPLAGARPGGPSSWCDPRRPR